MAFRKLRQRRYNKLIEYHFLPFEAKELSKIPIKTPYMLGGLREKLRAYQDAIKEYKTWNMKLTRTEWREVIREMYIAKDWLKEGKSDVWQMLRAWEDRHKDKHPEYESPPRRRKVKVKRKAEFVSKFAKGLEAYEKGRYK